MIYKTYPASYYESLGWSEHHSGFSGPSYNCIYNEHCNKIFNSKQGEMTNLGCYRVSYNNFSTCSWLTPEFLAPLTSLEKILYE